MEAVQPGPYLAPQVAPQPVLDSDSDSDGPALAGGLPKAGTSARSQVIHSGHFMLSSPHGHHRGPDPPGIDPTLTRLFECMSLAYSGKLVSPKWKNFKGLRLLCRDKVRLNNAIWRAWYIQYVERRKSPVCGFVTPLDGSEADAHRKPEAVVLEGNYWKRRIEVVMKEYHKWRIYYKKRLHRFSREGEISSPKPGDEAWKPTNHWCDQLFSNVVPMLLRDKGEEEDAEGRQLFDLDSFLSDISDTLFTMTQAGCPPQPAPDEAYIGNADMIQPDLAPLQPNMDDFMEISERKTPSKPSRQMAIQPPTDFFSAPRLLPTQSSMAFQDQGCFGPLPEPLCLSTVAGSDGSGTTNLLPACPASSPQAPSPRLQTSGGFPAQLGSSPGVFLSPDPPPAPISGGLAPSLKPSKPPMGCNLPGKWLGLDSYPSYDPGCPLTSPTHPRLPYPPSALFPRLTPSPSFSGFPPNVPIYGVDPPSPGYPHPPFGTPHLHPEMPLLGMGRSNERPKAKSSSTKAKRGHRPAPDSVPNPCLAQLLTTAKPEPSLEALPTSPPGQNVIPSTPESLHSIFCEDPVGYLPRMGQPSPRLSPSSSPSGSVSVAPSAPLIPKTERLSPTPVCAVNTRRMSEQGSPVSAEGLVALNPYSSPRSRTEPNKTESRRITHISAEQKRRFNIKVGFDTLHGLVSTLSAQPSLKVSKATTLQKTAEYICKLQQERTALQDEAQRLRDQIEGLNAAINLCQQQLPDTGVPITRQRFDQMREMFDQYVRSCTLQNWKFWVFSIIMRPLFESFNGMVSTSSIESLSQTSLAWLDQYCSLPALRPTVLSSLRQLSVSTSILTNPGAIPEQAAQAVTGTMAHHASS